MVVGLEQGFPNRVPAMESMQAQAQDQRQRKRKKKKQLKKKERLAAGPVLAAVIVFESHIFYWLLGCIYLQGTHR